MTDHLPEGSETPTPPPVPAPPCLLVIFGAGGDLTKRKLIPALANLAATSLLPEQFAVVGTGRAPLEHAEFRDKIRADLAEFATRDLGPEIVDGLIDRLYFAAGELDDPKFYPRLEKELQRVEQERGTGGSRVYYLATPPSLFAPIVQHLGAAGMTAEEEGRFRRVVVEKPFGHDLDSARALNRDLLAVLSERQIYRIDHYLGKETVQNILAFRFANGIFEPVWNRRYIDHVQITVAETVGVEGRGELYESSGALRDVLQNHVFQLLAFVAMEPPISFHADAVRDERVKVLRAIRPLSHEDVLQKAVRGQYGEGTI
ncbi:MAG TPA: glucose-6-phosphate dehydrogenase, partial [Thermoanaerobaculia bacterium]|nr:glucose-6-phosphate dehydrogenase [Thermoanaerobaculia bacterium]